MTELTEAVLQLAKSGDRRAVANLVRWSHRPLRAFVASLLLNSNDVDDVAQEVYLRALERLKNVESVETLAAFLRGIARNVVRERQRKFVREENAFLRLVDGWFERRTQETGPPSLADPETLSALHACLDRLPDRSREFLALRYSEELNSDQIGGRFEIKGTAVRAALKRARVALLECMRSRCPTAGEPG